MDLKQYTKLAIETESKFGVMSFPGGLSLDSRVFHAAIGVATEAGELLDPLKKYAAYGRELDLVNLQEETGDCLWYCAVLADCFNIDLREIQRWAERRSEGAPKSGLITLPDVGREFDFDLWDGGRGLFSIASQMMEGIYSPMTKDVAEYYLQQIFKNLKYILDSLGGTFEEEADRNIKKLNAKMGGKKSRYGSGFSSEEAIDRNTTKERELLEE